MRQVDYAPRLPSANAFDYYYALGRQAQDAPEESRELPLTRREVEWLRRNQSLFQTLAQAQSRDYTLPQPFQGTEDFSYLSLQRKLARVVYLQLRWHLSENDGQDFVRELIRKPTAYVQLRAEVEAHLRRHIQDASEAFALKGGRFHSSAPSPHAPSGDALRDYLLQYFEPLSLVGNVARQYWEMRTRRRLLALHLLLRAYYLRERRYPDNLRQLPIGAWATDPFSGELPVYQREGDRYRLYSVGVADTPAQR